MTQKSSMWDHPFNPLLDAIANELDDRPMRRGTVDDGLRPSLARGATFSSELEIVELQGIKNPVAVKQMIPFSKIRRSNDHTECVCFFENDSEFADLIRNTSEYLDEFSKFPYILTPDCSLYIDMPFLDQLTNIGLSRRIGHRLEISGVQVIPTVRWSDERTYEPYITEVPVSFIGIPKHSVVAIGTYGVTQNRVLRTHLISGIEAMLHWIKPIQILVYGPFSEKYFGRIKKQADFCVYEDWTSRMCRHDG